MTREEKRVARRLEIDKLLQRLGEHYWGPTSVMGQINLNEAMSSHLISELELHLHWKIFMIEQIGECDEEELESRLSDGGEWLHKLLEIPPTTEDHLKSCLEWMESLRVSGDAGNWYWENGDEYSRASNHLKNL